RESAQALRLCLRETPPNSARVGLMTIVLSVSRRRGAWLPGARHGCAYRVAARCLAAPLRVGRTDARASVAPGWPGRPAREAAPRSTPGEQGAYGSSLPRLPLRGVFRLAHL